MKKTLTLIGRFIRKCTNFLTRYHEIPSYSVRLSKPKPDISTAQQIAVKKSTIPNAGLGLFALKQIKANSIICEYEGQVITFFHLFFMKDWSHLGGLTVFHYIRPYLDDIGQFANHQFNDHQTNAYYERHALRCKLYIKAQKDIEVGEEIFVNYSKVHLYTQKWVTNSAPKK